jgi:ketosteroid isomerase-like protein
MLRMDRSSVQAWLDRYIDAWRANAREPIEALFTDDVVYRFAPFGEKNVARGIDAVVKGWLDNPDPPGSWEANYEPFAVDGDRAVATGISRYAATGTDPARTYHNVYLLEFAADGRCSAFTELYMLEKQG